MSDTMMSILLSDPSPCLRYQILTGILGMAADDAEVQEVDGQRESDPIFKEAQLLQKEDGSWQNPDTSAMLLRLGVLGFNHTNPVVSRGADYLFSEQLSDGSWPIPTAPVFDGKERVGYDMIPLQTALPLSGLCSCGYAQDQRVMNGFDWLLEQRLPDGVWPTGLASGVHGYVAGYRRMPHSRWGCRSNTTGSLIALSLHPSLSESTPAQHALDLLLARETHEQSTLGFQTARTLGFEPTRGFFTRFALFDPGLIAELAARIGATTDDERIEDLVIFIQGQKGQFGLWEYENRRPASRWISFKLVQALAQIDENSRDSHWISNEPRTPFTAYERPKKRW